MENRKEKLKSNIILLLFTGIILSVLWFTGYFFPSRTGEIAKFKTACDKYEKIDVFLKSEYEKTTISKRSMEVDFNKFSYVYQINGVNYTVSEIKILDDNPKEVITVWYDKKNPSSNETEDPCKKYNSIKDDKESDYPIIFGSVTVLFILLFIYNIFSLIKNCIMFLFENLNKKQSN